MTALAFTMHPGDLPGVPFKNLRQQVARALLDHSPIHTGEWHAVDTSKSKVHATYEVVDLSLWYDVPTTPTELVQDIQPNMPWAEDHFLERVSGESLNPPPSSAWWPFGNTTRHQDATEKFSHTYPERFWPKHSGHHSGLCPVIADMAYPDERNQEAWGCDFGPHQGIRYDYGDLLDVVKLLATKPLTRQAYLPVWFPEDTGNVPNVRVPCTLGYHFMIRDGLLSCRYYMRSCDFIRHFQDDVYLAARLMQWICDQVNKMQSNGREMPSNLANLSPATMYSPIDPGRLVMYISSLHAFVGDQAKMEAIINEDQ